jgi:hypothetical protein
VDFFFSSADFLALTLQSLRDSLRRIVTGLNAWERDSDILYAQNHVMHRVCLVDLVRYGSMLRKSSTLAPHGKFPLGLLHGPSLQSSGPAN